MVSTRGRSMTRRGARRSPSSSRGTRGSYRGSSRVSVPRSVMTRWSSSGNNQGAGPIKPVSFKRRWFNSTYTFSTAGPSTGFWNNIQFAMNSLPNLTEYQALFREYKLNRVKLTFVPRYDGVDQTGAGTGASKALISMRVVGPDAVVPAGSYNQSSLNAFLETGARTRVFNRPISVFFKPTIPRDVNDAVVAVSGPTWMRLNPLSSGPNQVHHGVSFYMHFNGFAVPTSTFTCDVYYTYYFQLRNPA